MGKRERKSKVRGEGGEIAVANKAFQQTLQRRHSAFWVPTSIYTRRKTHTVRHFGQQLLTGVEATSEIALLLK